MIGCLLRLDGVHRPLGRIVFGFQRTYRLWELKKRQTGAAHAAPIAFGQLFVFFRCVVSRTSRSLMS